MKERRAITVRGIIQGVGFRPFVHGLAVRLNLHGFVNNQAGGVRIEVEGDKESVDLFQCELMNNPLCVPKTSSAGRIRRQKRWSALGASRQQRRGR